MLRIFFRCVYFVNVQNYDDRKFSMLGFAPYALGIRNGISLQQVRNEFRWAQYAVRFPNATGQKAIVQYLSTIYYCLK